MTRVARPSDQHQRGMTLVELMVSLIVVSIAVAFTFRIYSQSSSAYRTQARVAELQQTLRTTKDQLVKDLRLAGYYAAAIRDASGGDPTFVVSPVSVVNNADGTGPDQFQVVYADESCAAHVQQNGNPFVAAVSLVDDTSCFADGDIAVAVRTKNPQRGEGCVLKITQVVPGGPRLQHNPGAPGAPYNAPRNTQCGETNPVCTGIACPWGDGGTTFMKYIMRAYRIKPNDARGVLQVSTAGFGGPWEDLGFGFTDLQIALYIYDPLGAVDTDGDGNAQKNWVSGANMNGTGLLSPNKQLLQARLSIVARTTWEVDGVMTAATPNLQGTGAANANSIGDHPSITLVNSNGQSAITDKTNRLYGNHIFRSVSAMVDFRNMGIEVPR